MTYAEIFTVAPSVGWNLNPVQASVTELDLTEVTTIGLFRIGSPVKKIMQIMQKNMQIMQNYAMKML